jgi:hypothetical protein
MYISCEVVHNVMKFVSVTQSIDVTRPTDTCMESRTVKVVKRIGHLIRYVLIHNTSIA